MDETRVNLVRHYGDQDVKVIEPNITYEQALLRIEMSDEDLDIISCETGRFLSWVIK